MDGRLLSFWESLFSGAMLVFRGAIEAETIRWSKGQVLKKADLGQDLPEGKVIPVIHGPVSTVQGEMNVKKNKKKKLTQWSGGFPGCFMGSLPWIHGDLWWFDDCAALAMLSNPRIFGYMEHLQMRWNKQLGWSFSQLVGSTSYWNKWIGKTPLSCLTSHWVTWGHFLIIKTLSLSSWG